MIEESSLAQRIRDARHAAGFTQRDLAVRIGVPLGLIDRYEKGLADPRPNLEQIAEATGRGRDWFDLDDFALPADEDTAESVNGLLAEERATLGKSQELEQGWNELKRSQEALARKDAKLAERQLQLDNCSRAGAPPSRGGGGDG